MTGALTERDIGVLNELCPTWTDEPITWMRPQDVGGHNGSHHSATLVKLWKLGYVEAKQRGSSEEDLRFKPFFKNGRGSRFYRISAEGVDYIVAWRGKPRQTKAEWQAWFDARQLERKGKA